jgi:two-component sensor histidine kinase
VRAFDWASTPLGPSAQWPLELKTAVGLLMESSFPGALVWGPELITIYNDAFRPILGHKPEALGRSFRDIWAEAWDIIGPIAQRALAGESTFIEDFELEIERFGRPETAWFTFCYSPVRLADGSVGGMLDTVVETTATVRARQASELMRQELGHRLKNTLAMAQSIAWHTLRKSAGSEAMDAFQARLLALSRAHEVLLQHQHDGMDLGELVHALLLVHGDRFTIAGPSVYLNAHDAVELSLLLHELATNAAKYGALSSTTGSIDLRWKMEGGHLLLQWREHGGPPVRAPRHTGFGTRLMDMGLLGSGAVERRYPSHGVEVDLRMPVREGKEENTAKGKED